MNTRTITISIADIAALRAIRGVVADAGPMFLRLSRPVARQSARAALARPTPTGLPSARLVSVDPLCSQMETDLNP